MKLEKTTPMKSMFLKKRTILLFLLASLIFDETNALDSMTLVV